MCTHSECCSTNWSPELIRSEEHTPELQSQFHLVCRRLLEKKKGDQDGVSAVEGRPEEPRELAAGVAPRGLILFVVRHLLDGVACSSVGQRRLWRCLGELGG